MKTAKIVFSLLLLSIVFVSPRGVKSQTIHDTVYNSVYGTGSEWRFSFKHDKHANLSITNIVLWIDTNTLTGYPDVRFSGEDQSGPASNQSWSNGNDLGMDSAYWCTEDPAAFIGPGIKDSFFDYVLQPNPNNQNANIYGYPIEIHWFSNWATENTNGDPCSAITGQSYGSFYV